eukprot:2371447-Pleurochrysis_carterae.AAC.2
MTSSTGCTGVESSALARSAKRRVSGGKTEWDAGLQSCEWRGEGRSGYVAGLGRHVARLGCYVARSGESRGEWLRVSATDRQMKGLLRSK